MNQILVEFAVNQKMNQFDTSNKNHFLFQTDELQFHILGGISTYSMDKLRVTLKVNRNEDEYNAIRHNIDLYNHNGVEKFVRRIAEYLKISTGIIRRSLQELIHRLENYRLSVIDRIEEEEAEEYLLSKKERQAAINFLKTKHLLKNTNKYIGQSGVIGEEVNRLLMYIIFTTRKTENPLNCISFGSSGSGKTYLQSKVAELIPEEERLSLTSLSGNSLYYFKKNELKNKLILLEDMDGAQNILYPLRELQTKKKITKSVVQKVANGQGATRNLTVEGPISVAGCTTRESIYEDNSNRSFLIYIDESPEQDERIMQYQRRASAGKIHYQDEIDAQTLLKNVQRLLSSITVRNPFAEYLSLPKSVFKPRRTNTHYLQFIEAITFYHQYQRQKQYDSETGEEYIETTLDDIKMANDLIKGILLRKSDSLNGVTRNYLETLKEYLNNKHEKIFTNREIRRELRIKETTLRRYHRLLLDEEYIRKRNDIEAESFCYELIEVDEFRDLEKSIEKALDICLTSLLVEQG